MGKEQQGELNAAAGDGFAPLYQAGSLILKEGDSLDGWVIGKDDKGQYLNMLTDKGIVRIPLSMNLTVLIAFAGRPIKVRIVCMGEQKTPAGSMKIFHVGYKREAPDSAFTGLLTGDTKIEEIPY